MQAWSTN